MLRNTRFCTFGKEKRGYKLNNDNVGPDKYNPLSTQIKQKNPEWRFGSSKRVNEKENNIPGPGQYQIELSYSKKLGKIGKDTRKNFHKNSTPGPGTYKNESLFESNIKKKKGTSLYSKGHNIPKSGGPSPTHYQCPSIFEKNKKEGRGFSLAKSIRTNNNSKNVPGPGNYELDKKANTFIGGKIGKEKKSDYKSNNVPGPGNYELKTTISQDVPKYSFGNMKRDQESTKCTGPFFYDSKIEATKTNAPNWSFGKNQLRPDSMQKEKLGPGTYNLELKKTKKGGKFGKERKCNNGNLNNFPGPGSYANQSTVILKNNLGNSLKSKNFKTGNPKFQNSLGPGHYDVNMNPIKKRVASCKFGTSKNGFYNTNNNPGCGTYDPKTDLIFQKAPNCKFGSSKNRADMKNNHVPGPGEYKIATEMEKKNKFSLGAKFTTPNRFDSPGPGKYDPKDTYNSLKPNININGKFGKDQKIKSDIKENFPSPGDYFKEAIPSKGKNILFGKDEKFKQNNKEKKPDFYNIKSCFEENVEKKKGPSLYFKTNPLKNNMDIPGPGTYNLNEDQTKGIPISNMKNSQKFAFPKNERFYNPNINNKEVGPGKYETNALFDLKNNKKSYLGKNIRFKDKKNLNPGPGDYEIISTFKDIPQHIKDQIQFKITI